MTYRYTLDIKNKDYIAQQKAIDNKYRNSFDTMAYLKESIELEKKFYKKRPEMTDSFKGTAHASDAHASNLPSSRENSQSGTFGNATTPKTTIINSTMNNNREIMAKTTVEIMAFEKVLNELNTKDINKISNKSEQVQFIQKKELYKKGIESLRFLSQNQKISDTPEARREFQEKIVTAKKNVKLMFEAQYGEKINDQNAKDVLNFIQKNDFYLKDKKGSEIKLDKKLDKDKKEKQEALKEAQDFFANNSKRLDDLKYEDLDADKIASMIKHLNTALKNLDDDKLFTYQVNNENKSITDSNIKIKIEELEKYKRLFNVFEKDKTQSKKSTPTMETFNQVKDWDNDRHNWIYSLSDKDFFNFVKKNSKELAKELYSGYADTATHGLIIKRLCSIRKEILKTDAFNINGLTPEQKLQLGGIKWEKDSTKHNKDNNFGMNNDISIGEQFKGDNADYWAALYNALTDY